MLGPVDDERVARWTITIRRTAFALVMVLGGGIVIHGCAVVAATSSFDSPELYPPQPPAWYAWIAACATGVLAWWIAGHRRDVMSTAGLAMAGGALNSPLACLVIGVVEAVATHRLRALGPWIRCATGGSLIGVPVGAVIGALAAATFVPLGLALERVSRRPTITSMPRAMCVAAAWTAVCATAIASVRWTVEGAHEGAIALATSATVVLVLACVELVRRRWRVRAIERGAIAGWSVERDDHGTRWLVRETHAGEGAYREGVVRTRWGRLDA
ncbi:hypothetical protein [Sandaracinus amylolyticus]|uniref:hypothetical protein n=1 Tax=Sandaracinus amylolyticus TaxID=927083 RepID=UPI001F418857|nr:hypothetical protein [Sandaracinus amylolyticus]UJR85278.1 Hypothetical protein I5071_73580 [Sandaracinus amylolyticus]